jgi:hypothetical protein
MNIALKRSQGVIAGRTRISHLRKQNSLPIPIQITKNAKFIWENI